MIPNVECGWCGIVIEDLLVSQENSGISGYRYALCTGLKRVQENGCIDRRMLNKMYILH